MPCHRCGSDELFHYCEEWDREVALERERREWELPFDPEKRKRVDEAIQKMDHSLTTHPPAGQATISDMERVRSSAKQLGIDIIVRTPESRERDVALQHLEDTVMWAIKAIAVNQ